ncbi:MAG: hypothetical protein WC455_12170 [Dehalococcoidia bacterium]|jgi:hypothetical protein
MSVLGTILNKLETLLADINTGEGYNTNVQTVLRKDVDWTNRSELSPGLMIIPSGEAVAAVIDADGVRFEQRIIIGGFVRNTDPDQLQAELLNLSADVKKVIYPDASGTRPSLGTACFDVAYLSEATAFSKEVGKFEMDVVITYYCAKGTF